MKMFNFPFDCLRIIVVLPIFRFANQIINEHFDLWDLKFEVETFGSKYQFTGTNTTNRQVHWMNGNQSTEFV